MGNKKLLFLVGEIRRDMIPRALSAGSVGVDEDLQCEQLALKLGETGRPRWVVIFSRTSSDTVMEILLTQKFRCQPDSRLHALSLRGRRT